MDSLSNVRRAGNLMEAIARQKGVRSDKIETGNSRTDSEDRSPDSAPYRREYVHAYIVAGYVACDYIICRYPSSVRLAI